MKYDVLIEKLENIIDNWYDKYELVNYIHEPYDGLCDNIKSGGFGGGVPKECISSWMYFNGCPIYPVGGVDEYDIVGEERYSLFNNPKRLHLAVHMLQWFRFHNI